MSWEAIYTDDSAAAKHPEAVAAWAARLRQLGFDDPAKLHPFAFRDLSEDLVKDRLLVAYQMGLGKTAMAIAAAAATGTKHTLFVVPNKLMGEWERELRRLGFGYEYQIITRQADIDAYTCPAGCGPVTTFQRVIDAEGRTRDVRRECQACGRRAAHVDVLKRFNLISMRTLWTLPKDSPHAERDQKRAAVKNQYGGLLKRERTGLKHSFAHRLRRRCNFVIIDEAYAIGNPSSLQTRAVFLLKPDRRWLLTGTPIKGYPDNILALLNWCLGNGTDLFPDFDHTLESSRKNFLGLFGTTITKVREDGSKYDKLIPKIRNPERFQAMLAPVMRRRVNLEPEVAAAIRMPDFMLEPLAVEPDPLLRDMYEACVTDFVAWYKERLAEAQATDQPLPRMSLLTKLNYLSQLAAAPQACVPSYDQLSSKQERILDLIRDATARGRKVILFSEHVASATWWATSGVVADLEPVLITGAVSLSRGKRSGTSERERRLSAFRDGDAKLLVATTRCIAEGFNLPEASVVIFDSFPWVPSLQQQAWSRVLRPAQRHSPVEIYLVELAGTIDTFLSAICAIKRTAIAEGIDHETVEIEADDVPDPFQYANHLVAATNAVSATYDALGWVDRLKAQAAEAVRAGRNAA